MIKGTLHGVVAAFALLLGSSAQAGFPEKPIKIVVPFTAGTATDTMSRIVAQAYSARLGQPVIVENRPGADGAIGAVAMARAEPDGYTLLMSTNGFSAVPAMRKTPPYDPLTDFTPISMVGRYSFFLFVNSQVPVRTMQELIDHARANPGKLNYGTGNPTGIVAMGQILALTGAEMRHIPYKGEPAAMTDLVANRVQVLIATPTTGGVYAQEGKLRMLATTLPERSPAFPDVPTMEEAGIRGFAVPSWAALQGPKGMPRDVVDRLAKELAAVLEDPAIREQFAQQKFLPASSSPEALRTFVENQIDLYTKTLRQAGVEPE
ncbi:Bug family tripartite tricarboxylate transporter substrate binding protein [Bordetella sp. 2513F-2]